MGVIVLYYCGIKFCSRNMDGLVSTNCCKNPKTHAVVHPVQTSWNDALYIEGEYQTKSGSWI
jgi:hypothetical protein